MPHDHAATLPRPSGAALRRARHAVGDHPRSQHLIWRVQRVGWWALGLVVAAACGGLLGAGGPLAERTVEQAEGGFAITHERVVRQARPTVWSVLLPAGTSTLVLHDPATAVFEPRLVVPRPVLERWVDGAVIMQFAHDDGAATRVRLVLVPTQAGTHSLAVGAGQRMATLTIVSLP